MLQMKYVADQRWYELRTRLKFFTVKIVIEIFSLIVVNRENNYNREKF